jgi:hypothetical protein
MIIVQVIHAIALLVGVCVVGLVGISFVTIIILTTTIIIVSMHIVARVIVIIVNNVAIARIVGGVW